MRRSGDAARPVTPVWEPVLRRVFSGGERFAGLVATSVPEGTRVSAVLAGDRSLSWSDVLIPAEEPKIDSLTPHLAAAGWYERAIADLHGVQPVGHPRPEPLVLPLDDHAARPRPGTSGNHPLVVIPDEHAMRAHVHGTGMFMISYGPVRSGVTESVEYLVETPGEDIPHLRVRIYPKHRGIQSRFGGLDVGDGVLLAERVEGIATVAHALAFCEAVERVAQVEVPLAARLVRTLHAELERIANHVDVALRLCDAAGLSVATARMGFHKERLLRLVSRMCGSRFGRGVLAPGGVHRMPVLAPDEVQRELARIARRLRPDLALLMRTPSFLDRVRTTGPLAPQAARRLFALGPVGRASGYEDDDRWRRPYAAYGMLPPAPVQRDAGDAQARLEVRIDEIDASLRMCSAALEELTSLDATTPSAVSVPATSGRALGWAEAPQGEVVYDVELADGRVLRACPRSASMHNLSLFHEVFRGDIFTDFPFIEASFGVSVAGTVL